MQIGLETYSFLWLFRWTNKNYAYYFIGQKMSVEIACSAEAKFLWVPH